MTYSNLCFELKPQFVIYRYAHVKFATFRLQEQTIVQITFGVDGDLGDFGVKYTHI
jgi:hypothetical protein